MVSLVPNERSEDCESANSSILILRERERERERESTKPTYQHVVVQVLTVLQFIQLSKLVRPLAMALILVLSYSRTTSLLQGYSAPMHVYRQLSSLENTSSTGSTVCIGSEWHRFPSSFFLPSSSYKVSWVDDGFRGLLPFPFNSTAGGTRVAPAYFNNQNQASSGQFAVAERSFLDNQKSPPLYRAFFIPWLWENKNTFGVYRLLRKR
ncbi:hypothetical protein O6H91_Y398500 [Diphasiastrum complanatum]|nr:hypothetical protein O6H91_Y398500 [Diphasiastrum complanatum]